MQNSRATHHSEQPVIYGENAVLDPFIVPEGGIREPGHKPAVARFHIAILCESAPHSQLAAKVRFVSILLKNSA